MIRPTAGHVSLLGTSVRRGGRGPWDRVGYLVDAPAPYPRLTVLENLRSAARLRDVGDSPVTRAVEQFGLERYAERRANSLSQGNRQRLGLAMALFHKPELVILDEPANGLDPAGVVEVRGLLRSLAADRGVTVLMSSHILAEVDRLATRIGIIHRGRLIEELSTQEMEKRRARRLVVEARDAAGAFALLEAAGYEPAAGDGHMVLTQSRRCGAARRRRRGAGRRRAPADAPRRRAGGPRGALPAPHRAQGGIVTGLVAALGVELLKARRSVAPALTALAFTIAPLVGGLFMYILADPERARRMGLIGQKAQLAGGGSDWTAYFGFLAQAATVGGFVLFAFVVAWVFGREFSDGTVRYLLALPTSQVGDHRRQARRRGAVVRRAHRGRHRPRARRRSGSGPPGVVGGRVVAGTGAHLGRRGARPSSSCCPWRCWPASAAATSRRWASRC